MCDLEDEGNVSSDSDSTEGKLIVAERNQSLAQKTSRLCQNQTHLLTNMEDFRSETSTTRFHADINTEPSTISRIAGPKHFSSIKEKFLEQP